MLDKLEVAKKLIKEHNVNTTEKSMWTSYYNALASIGIPRKNNMYGQRTPGSKEPSGSLFTLSSSSFCSSFSFVSRMRL